MSDIERAQSDEGETGVSRSAFLRWLAPCLIFLFALVVRGLSWRSVLIGDRVVYHGNDAYYHMRRVFYSLANFPDALAFDRYVNFPDGARIIWPPFFDTVLATLLLPFYRPGQEGQVERLAIWIPPLLGALTILALFYLARRLFGDAVAIASASLLSILSGHVWYSQLGFIDHHVAVSLASTAVLASAVALFRILETHPYPRVAVAWRAALSGALCVVLLLVWPGGILYVVLMELGLLALLLASQSRRHAAQIAETLGVVNAVALLLVFPLAAFNTWPQWSEFSSVVLSRFQPWFFAALALYGWIGVLLWGRGEEAEGIGESHVARAAQGVALGLLVLGGSAFLLPELVQAVLDAWQWMAKDESFQVAVFESAPLFQDKGVFSTRIAELRLSRFLYLFPVGVLWIGWSTRKRADFNSILFLLGWSVILCGVTLLQKRFFNSFSVAMALVSGWVCVQLYAEARARIPKIEARAAAYVALSVFAGWLLWPTLTEYPSYWGDPFDTSPRTSVPLVSEKKLRLIETAEWIRDHTPPTAGFLDASMQPEYGVFAFATHGHVIKYVAQRPTALGNFGDDVGEESYESWIQVDGLSAAEAIEPLVRRGIRYVVAVASRKVTHLERDLLFGNGSGLGRYRLVYTFPRLERGRVEASKVFELVEGANLTGRADAGAAVKLSLYLRTNLGKQIPYKATVYADDAGRYSFRLPYATRGGAGAVQPTDRYRLKSLDRIGRFDVSEEQVQSGAAIQGPDLRGSAGALE